jgi:hypothetical protein
LIAEPELFAVPIHRLLEKNLRPGKEIEDFTIHERGTLAKPTGGSNAPIPILRACV